RLTGVAKPRPVLLGYALRHVRAILYEDELEVLERLGEHAVDRLAEKLRALVDRDHHRDQRRRPAGRGIHHWSPVPSGSRAPPAAPGADMRARPVRAARRWRLSGTESATR